VRPEGGGVVPDPEKCKPGTVYHFSYGTTLTQAEKVGPGLPLDRWGTVIVWDKDDYPKIFEGAVRIYPLYGAFGGEHGCSCESPRFGLDDYGRLHIPCSLTCTVQVVDNEGNEIMKFGSYGNSDDRGAADGKAKPAIPLGYPIAAKPSFNHIYVADEGNRRAVRVDPTWKAEATCEVK
jgi:DNA-binding beta-propeller fold protein YncE